MGILLKILINKKDDSVTFEPSPLNAETGDQIFWVNNDDKAHWPGLPGKPKFFMPNQIAPGSTSSTFSPGKTETLKYVCSLHPGETGTINVT